MSKRPMRKGSDKAIFFILMSYFSWIDRADVAQNLVRRRPFERLKQAKVAELHVGFDFNNSFEEAVATAEEVSIREGIYGETSSLRAVPDRLQKTNSTPENES